MTSHLVVTVTGPDRPGIVRRVTEVLVRHGANLEESRMAQLGGEFAAIMLVAVPEESARGLEAALAGLTDEALQIFSKPTAAQAGAFAGYVACEVRLAGADHQGIVHTVADFLARQGINIEELDTEVTNAPETGAALFSMRAAVQTPPELSCTELEQRLEEIAQRLGVDITVTPSDER